MKTVERSEILDYVTYEEQRAEIRASAMRAKDARRVHVGSHLTFLFENHETIRYQVLEMTRAERMVKEADIRHELETYNELLGQGGDLGCTLLIEIADPAERAEKLSRWMSLVARLYARLEDGTKARPTYDMRQVGDQRLSSVQYLKFPVGGRAPVAIGCDHADPSARGETELSAEQREALRQDLA
jgi:chromosome condensin MukBEF ATPase and DNA-binding subunit MukB